MGKSYLTSFQSEPFLVVVVGVPGKYRTTGLHPHPFIMRQRLTKLLRLALTVRSSCHASQQPGLPHMTPAS